MSYDDARRELLVLTCGSCRHWQAVEQPPVRGPVIVGEQQAKQGQCRERLHSTQLPHEAGKIFFVGYPPVPENFPACGQYKEKASVLEN